ncbi:MAG: hydroxyethylthiazole kinase [Pseudorhodoplanes sp.]
MHGSDQSRARDLPHATAEIIARLRERRPRVHCITNAVAQNFTPNVLLAAGAIPSMTIAPEEVAAFVARSDALLVNLGTLDAARREATVIAVERAAEKDIPWLLDPVFIDRSEPRCGFARGLMARRPNAVRLNAAEFRALSGSEAGEEAVSRFASEHRVTIGLTGATDLVADGAQVVRIANGHPLMERVTAMGCAGTALIAACFAVARDPVVAMGAGLLILDIAGEVAAQRARGPGSFAVEILDALHAIDGETIERLARVS